MISEAECIQALRLFIERGSRDELEKAQGAMLQYALSQPDAPVRSGALEKLRAALATICDPEKLPPLQNAFYPVVDAMIQRTSAAVDAT